MAEPADARDPKQVLIETPDPLGRGRPSRLTVEVEQRFIAALRTGAYRKIAAEWCGVGDKTVQDWMRRGRDEPDSYYAVFRAKVIEAERAAEIEIGTSLYSGVRGKPDLELKYMQLRYRNRWKTHDRVEHVGRGGGPIQTQAVPMNLDALDDTELESLENLLKKAARPVESASADPDPGGSAGGEDPA
jgi:transposase